MPRKICTAHGIYLVIGVGPPPLDRPSFCVRADYRIVARRTARSIEEGTANICYTSHLLSAGSERLRCFSKTRRSCGSCRFCDGVIVANSEQIALLDFGLRVLRIRPSPAVGIFFAVDRCYMGWIFIKIRSTDSKFHAVRVNPFPQTFA
jgi:hypothetical protein